MAEDTSKMNMNKPLVSICCITYNHAPFIRQCLDGFLMQQLSLEALPYRKEYEVGFEILIHDDCSTDGTTEIIKEYAAKYPDIIKPLYEKENQYSKGVWVDGYNYRRAQGKYIAYCEGDDYWTDPLKLQKQIEFMEANPEYSVCWCMADITFADTGIIQKGNHDVTQNTEVTAKDFLLYGKEANPLTLVFRVSDFSYEWSKHYTCYLDTMEIYHLLKVGKGIVLNFKGGVYRIHKGGISSSMSDKTRSWENVRDGYEMYHYIGDKATRDFYLKSLFYAFDLCHSNKERFAVFRQVWKQTPSIALFVVFKQIKRNIK